MEGTWTWTRIRSLEQTIGHGETLVSIIIASYETSGSRRILICDCSTIHNVLDGQGPSELTHNTSDTHISCDIGVHHTVLNEIIITHCLAYQTACEV